MRASSRAVLTHVPLALILTRFLIAFSLIFDAQDGHLSFFFLPLFVFAVFSDYLDGFICRKINLSSVQLSALDGYADAALYLSVCFSIWLVYPDILNKYFMFISGLLLLQIVSWLFSLVKFWRITSYHTYTAKLWGVALCLSVVEALTMRSGMFIPIMALIGVGCITEDMIITSVMPYWKTGVINIQTARRLRDAHRTVTEQ